MCNSTNDECETWPFTLREEQRPRVLENMVLRRIFEHKSDEVTKEWRNHIMGSLMICNLHPILFR
jgi:hypothetical protein